MKELIGGGVGELIRRSEEALSRGNKMETYQGGNEGAYHVGMKNISSLSPPFVRGELTK